MSAEIDDDTVISAGTRRGGFAGGQLLLGRYLLERVLGQGGMGVVWLARDEQLERSVALKFLPDVVLNDRASLDDLKRETRRSLELTHPNIVRTYDFIQDENIAGISMEYVDSDTLRNMRADQTNGVFQPHQLGAWIRELCLALDYAHHHAAVVHRDLKPSNLMISSSGELKIADFGIARSLTESISLLSMKHRISGTLAYMSPQQLAGDQASVTDDIYSVGATLYELLTSRPPFHTGDLSQQINTHIPPSMAERRAALGIPVGEVPGNWEETIASCLSKLPSARPPSAGEIAARLGLAEAATIPYRDATIPYREATVPYREPTAPELPAAAAPARKRFPVWAMVATPLVLAAAAAGAYWMMNGKTPETPMPRAAAATPAGATPAPARAPAPAAMSVSTPAVPQVGGLMITTYPDNATVTLDGLPPQNSPAAFNSVPSGTHTVRVRLDGYDPVNATVSVENGQIKRMDLIALQRSKGTLAVTSNPPGLPYALKVKGDPIPLATGSTPLAAADTPAGDYDVTVTRDGWPPQEKTVTVGRGQNQQVVFDFPSGKVSISSDPAGAEVKVGDDSLGETPLEIPDTPAGQVSYTLEHPGYLPAVVSGTLADGATLSLQTVLQKARGEHPHDYTYPPEHHHAHKAQSPKTNTTFGGRAEATVIKFISNLPHPKGSPEPHKKSKSSD